MRPMISNLGGPLCHMGCSLNIKVLLFQKIMIGSKVQNPEYEPFPILNPEEGEDRLMRWDEFDE